MSYMTEPELLGVDPSEERNLLFKHQRLLGYPVDEWKQPQCHWVMEPIPGTNKSNVVKIVFDD